MSPNDGTPAVLDTREMAAALDIRPGTDGCNGERWNRRITPCIS